MGPDNARSHLESNSSAELGIQSEFRALRNMPSARKKKSAASTAASDLKSSRESPSGGDISRGTRLPPAGSDSSNPSGDGDVTPPLKQVQNPLSSLQRDSSDNSESEEEGFHFRSETYTAAAEECLAAIEAAQPEMSLTDSMRRRFMLMYPTMIAKGYDDDSAFIYIAREISLGHAHIPLLEALPKLFPAPKSYDVSAQNNGRLQFAIETFGAAVAGLDKNKVKANLSKCIDQGKIVQGFGKLFHSGFENGLEPVFHAGILNKANLPRMEQFQELTACGAAVAILGRSILAESYFAFERSPTHDDSDDEDDVEIGASMEDLVAARRNKVSSSNVKTQVKRSTGHFRPSMYFTTDEKTSTKYLKNLTQFVQNYKECMHVPFEFRYSLAILNEFSKYVLAYFRVVIAAFPFLFVGVDEFLTSAEGELLKVVRYPKCHGSFYEYRAIMEFNYSYIYLLPTLVKYIVQATSNEETSAVLPGFGDQIGDIFKYRLKSTTALYPQVVKFHRMIFDARQFCRMRDSDENTALDEKLMLTVSESQFNGLSSIVQNPNNRSAIHEIKRMLRENEFNTLQDVALKVQEFTQDGSLTPELASTMPLALVASVAPVQSHQASSKLCFEFQKTGSCRRGAQCRFKHNGSVTSNADVGPQLPVSTADTQHKLDDYIAHFEDAKGSIVCTST